MGMYDTAAEGIKYYGQQGAAIAEGQRQSGQIWGQTLASLGQMAANLPGQLAQQKELALKQQITGMQMDAMKRAQAGEQQANAIISGLPRNPDGTFDTGSVMQRLASANVPTDSQERLVKSIDGLNGVITSWNKSKQDHAADLADFLLRQHKPGEPITWDAVHLGVAAARSIGLANDGEVKQITDAIAQGGDPETLLKGIRDQGGAYKAQNAKIAEEMNKPVNVPEGGSVVIPATGQVVARGAAARKTESELAADAANPQSPTAAQSKAALEALNGPGNALKASQTAEANARVPLVNAEAAKAKAEADQLQSVAGMTAGAAGIPDVPNGQRNEAFLQTLPDATAKQVKALVEGRMQFPSSFALKTPYWQGMLQAVAKYDPSFDQVNFNARSKTRQDFTSGKSAQQVNAINTVVGHLSELSDKSDALGNTSIPFINTVKNWIGRQSGSPAVTNFETAKKAVADELTRVWRQAGGAEADIKSWQKSLDAANSPAQLHEAFGTIGGLLESKLSALQGQYQQGMGINDVQMITPKSRQALDKLEGKGGAEPAAGAAKTIEKFGATYELGADGLYHKKVTR